MRALDLIIKKRNGEALSAIEIQFLIEEFTTGNIPDYQMSAFAMAVFFKGMSNIELSHLTTSMLQSGSILDFSHIASFPVDKHSTGGVGDKISIPLAPAVAACGVLVPMISGRGLGHTGGTLDKLESIPGFSCRLTTEQLVKQIEDIGCSMGAATLQIAPADKKLYELRDVTGTVECTPLIASSIMSKKLAEGIKGLVLDVKYGSGAFMRDPHDAYELAKIMVEIGTNTGTNTVARLTSMQQPIGVMIGNSLEIIESIEVLKGQGPKDTIELVVELGAEMLLLAQKVASLEEGRKEITKVLQNGQALQKFKNMVEAQGGNCRIIDDYTLFTKAPTQTPILAKEAGFVASMNTYDIGLASVVLGGGREKASDVIDSSVGIEMKVRLADYVEKDQPLCIMHSSQKENTKAALLLQSAFQIQPAPVKAPDLFGPRITSFNL